jgi:phage/plasmid primase-like uncharacterized protein
MKDGFKVSKELYNKLKKIGDCYSASPRAVLAGAIVLFNQLHNQRKQGKVIGVAIEKDGEYCDFTEIRLDGTPFGGKPRE